MSPERIEPEKTCFFICPLGEQGSPERQRSDQVMKHIVKPAAQANELTAVRSDEGVPGVITHQIIEHVLKDRMVVADLSDQNANVFYEVALRHAFRQPIVVMIKKGQKLPFDVHNIRAIFYDLDLDGAADAREEVAGQIKAAMAEDFDPQSPVSIAAELKNLTRDAQPDEKFLIETILTRLDQMDRSISDIGRRMLPGDHLKDALSPFVQEELGNLIRSYTKELKLLESVRHAGVIGIFKRRAMALQAFTSAIDEEATEIMVVASSLKGLFQKEEYRQVAEKLRFKATNGLVNVRFLLTHPAVADFRAKQESRGPEEIGMEIIGSLEQLKEWPRERCEVRLYLGTPTCFAIKTTRKMLINPYPYVSVSYDSPCLILEYSPEGGTDRPAYIFDEFNTRHFGAWDTDLSIRVTDFDEAIARFRSELDQYAKKVEEILAFGPVQLRRLPT